MFQRKSLGGQGLIPILNHYPHFHWVLLGCCIIFAFLRPEVQLGKLAMVFLPLLLCFQQIV